ncbi:MAG: hypothetical protein CMQ61_15130 [Gammaproteobacteria bacterium]|nr:hypothetical protein [Gammaproteobacteria bacterium]
MRYRIDSTPASENMATTDDMYLLTVVLGLIIGVVLTALGIKGRQTWLVVWSVGLIIASIAYLIFV